MRIARVAPAAIALGLFATTSAMAQCVLATTAPAPSGPPMSMQVRGEGKRISITIENLTTGQAFSPPLFLSHNERAPPLFQEGQKASFGLMRIAEEGNTGPLLSEVVATKIGSVYGSIGMGGSVLPGGKRVVEIEVSSEFPMLSGAMMLVMTNDGFTGVNGVGAYDLQDPKTIELMAYEAGTERNNERKEFLIAMKGTGRDPEGGVVQRHTGIRGDADAPAGWRFDPAKPVARLTIAPFPGADMTGAVDRDETHER